ncbi:MAG: HEAT repeat domain-containing protein [Halanaerobiales bacterium]|nr:HEAT repeat domain-containing protein [Halanaerobiales bacterium]
MKKLFTKEDYIRFCEHDEELVRKWALENLITFYPNDTETLEISLKMYENETGLGFKYIIQKFLENNFTMIPENKLYTSFTNMREKDLSKTTYLAKLLAKKQYNLELLQKELYEMLSDENHDINSFIYLIEAYGELQSEDGYDLLLSLFRNSKLDHFMMAGLIENLLKYKNPDIIVGIIERLFELNPKRNDKERIIAVVVLNMSKISHAYEFYDYLDKFKKHSNELTDLLTSLNRFWPKNPSIKRLNELSNNFSSSFNNSNYKTTFLKIIKSIMHLYSERYDFINWIVDKDLVQDNKILSYQSSLKQEDFYISLIIQKLLANKKFVFKLKPNEQKTFIFLLLSLLIVALEEIDYEKAVEKVEKDPEYLWELFCYDREEISEQIVDLVVENGALYEDRLIEILQVDENIVAIDRAIKALGRLRSKKAIPYLIELLDKNLSDVSCEHVQEALIKIDDIPFEVITKAIMEGDDARAIFLLGVLEHQSYDEVAQFIIQAWEKGTIIFPDELAYNLRGIGSKYGIEILEDLLEEFCIDVYQTLLILYYVNGESKEKIAQFKERWAEDVAEIKDRQNELFNQFK